MNKVFYVVGESLDGELIEYEFEGTLGNCENDAKRVLTSVGGGHLDIFVNYNDHDEFVSDVEV